MHDAKFIHQFRKEPLKNIFSEPIRKNILIRKIIEGQNRLLPSTISMYFTFAWKSLNCLGE